MTATCAKKWDKSSDEYRQALKDALRWDADRQEPYLQLPSFPELRLVPFREGIEEELVSLFNEPEVGKRLYAMPYPMSREFAVDWVKRDVTKWNAIGAQVAAAVEPVQGGPLPGVGQGDVALRPREGAGPMQSMPFKSLLLVSPNASRIIGDTKLSIDTSPTSPTKGVIDHGEHVTETEALARPLVEQTWWLGYVLSTSQHGRGLMSEVVATIFESWVVPFMRIGKAVAMAELDNPASGKILAKAGFEMTAEVESQWPEDKGGGVRRNGFWERVIAAKGGAGGTTTL